MIEQTGEDIELDPADSEPDSDEGVVENEDGSASVVIGNAPDKSAEHYANIVEEVDRPKLNEFVTNLLESIEKDIEDREKRDKQYAEGIKRTGLGDDAPGGADFAGASKTVHPMLSKGCIDFAARAMKELWPSGGPTKSKIEGKPSKEVLAKAQRLTDFLNWQLTKQIPEARPDIEKLLSQVPLGGAQYLKVYHDHGKKRPCFEFVPIDDVFLPYLASSFLASDRRTHRQTITRDEFNRRVESGMYIEISLSDPQAPDESLAKQATDKVSGVQANSDNQDGGRTVYEVYVYMDIEDDESKPYIITIDKESEKPVGLYRNWEPTDTSKAEMMWMVEFPFIPWRGAYPIGLIHLIGSLSGATTGAVRAILDSALFQNAQTLLKLKSGMKGENINLTTGQVNEIDAGSTDDIRKLVMAMPYNPPSTVLFEMLGFLVQAGEAVVQTSFESLTDMKGDMPVGTTMALIEQGLVVFSAIHSRMHNAMGQTLEILCRVNRMYFERPAAYAGEITAEDFALPMSVIPVSDPNIFSEVQRFAQTQAIMQRADAKPGMYDAREVEERFLRQLKVPPEEVLTKKEPPPNMDPASENVAMTMGAPTFVLPPQDHIGHLLVHTPFFKSPIFSNPVMMQSYGQPMVSHTRDHILQYYLAETHKGVSMASQQKIIGDNAHQQAEAIVRVQIEVEKVIKPFVDAMNQLAQQVQQMLQPKQPPNPILQKAQMDIQAKQEQQQVQNQHESELQSQKDAAAGNRVDKQSAVKEQTNTEDNQTAMKITAAEILSGEHTNLRTGTGINPTP